jgi:hypothetical protein
MWRTRLLKACLLALLIGANVAAARQALAQANFDRRLYEFAGAIRRSGGLCASMRARPPLPRLEL